MFMEKFLDRIDTFTEYWGKIFRFIVVFLAAVMCFEVFCRYVLNRPTIWAFDVSTALYGASFALCSSYALLYKTHVMIDVFYNKLNLKGRAILDLVSYAVFFFPFIIVIITQGFKYAGESWAIKEQGWSAFPMPIYLTKSCIPAFGVTMGIQGLVTYLRAIMTLVTGEDWFAKCKYKKEEIQRIVMDDAPAVSKSV